jgi:hypothetical protein
MHVKIHGGTVDHGQDSLCHTCRHATIVRGTSHKHEIVDCRRLTDRLGWITFAVTSCTGYSDSRRPSLNEMEDIAWVLRSDARRNQIGFVRSRDLKPRERVYFEED